MPGAADLDKENADDLKPTQQLTMITEETTDEYTTQNTHDNLPNPLDALKTAEDPAAIMSKNPTEPSTNRGTVSN